MANLTINGLTSTDSVAATDVLPIWVTASSVTRKITWTDFTSGISGGAATWTTLAGASRASDSIVTISAGTVAPGTPLRYSTGGTVYRYGVVIDTTTATKAGICGAPVSADYATFQYADTNRIRTEVINVAGAWSTPATVTLLEDAVGMKNGISWQYGTAHLVKIEGSVKVEDTGANDPHLNVTIASNTGVCTLNTGEGIAPLTTVVNSAVAISTALYTVVYGNKVELMTDAAGSNDDSTDLKAQLTFVLE